MKAYTYLATLPVLLALCLLLVACGGTSGPKSDIDVNARILDLREEGKIIRISDLGAGRHYEMRATDTTEININNNKATFEDLQKGWQVRVWANELSGQDVAFEVVRLDVTDSGEAAPSRR